MRLSCLTPELPVHHPRPPVGLLAWSWGSWKVAALRLLHHSVGQRILCAALVSTTKLETEMGNNPFNAPCGFSCEAAVSSCACAGAETGHLNADQRKG